MSKDQVMLIVSAEPWTQAICPEGYVEVPPMFWERVKRVLMPWRERSWCFYREVDADEQSGSYSFTASSDSAGDRREP